MGIKERRERERQQQRQRILDAALAIISAEGFAALSMRKLAERIEYSAASIYLYFENREQIAQELSEAGFAELHQVLMAATAGQKAPASLRAYGTAYVAYGLSHPELYRLIFMGDSEYMTAAWAKQRENSAAVNVATGLRQLAAEVLEAGHAEGIDSTTAAEMIWSALHGIVSLHIACAAFQSTPPAVAVHLMMETLARGLGCP